MSTMSSTRSSSSSCPWLPWTAQSRHLVLYSRSVSQSRILITSLGTILITRQNARVSAQAWYCISFGQISDLRVKMSGWIEWNDDKVAVPGKFTHGICAAGPKLANSPWPPCLLQSHFRHFVEPVEYFYRLVISLYVRAMCIFLLLPREYHIP